jgi:hypothetical protein
MPGSNLPARQNAAHIETGMYGAPPNTTRLAFAALPTTGVQRGEAVSIPHQALAFHTDPNINSILGMG